MYFCLLFEQSVYHDIECNCLFTQGLVKQGEDDVIIRNLYYYFIGLGWMFTRSTLSTLK